jgi:hypothetical protein
MSVGLDRKLSAIGEVQDALISNLVSTSADVRHSLPLLPDELRRPDTSQRNLSRKGDGREAR